MNIQWWPAMGKLSRLHTLMIYFSFWRYMHGFNCIFMLLLLICCISLAIVYSKTCLKRPLKKKAKIQAWLSLYAGQKYCRMIQGEHSAILLTFIKLPSLFCLFLSCCLRQVLLYVMLYVMFSFLGHIRSYSESPDISDVDLGQDRSISLLTKLQLLGKCSKWAVAARISQCPVASTWVEVFRIIPEFRILRWLSIESQP